MKTRMTMLRSAQSVAVSLAAGFLSCLTSRNLHGQTVQTNIVVTSEGGSVTNASSGYAGEASAVFGFVKFGAVSDASAYLVSLPGTAQEASEVERSLASGLNVGIAHATVIGQKQVTSSQASVANINLEASTDFLAGWFFGGGFSSGEVTTISADFVMSEARAARSTTGTTSSGHSQISGLVINGQPVAVGGQANQVVSLSGGGYVVVDEQITGQASTTTDGQMLTIDGILVNALHVVMPYSGLNVVFGSSAAGVACGTPIGEFCGDFLTGGGWITGTPSGANADFGVAGGIKDGAFWGHLNYVDHGNGMHVKATAVTGYAVDANDPDCQVIDYTVTIDDQPGTAQVRVCDKGEPGLNDLFEITLSNGYHAGGDLGGSHPGGGDIQLHKCS